MCLLLTAILHFIHGMTDPVLMSLSASHVSSVRRHLPVLLVSAALFVLPVVLSYALWHHYALNTWLFAVTAFCVELCLKVRPRPPPAPSQCRTPSDTTRELSDLHEYIPLDFLCYIVMLHTTFPETHALKLSSMVVVRVSKASY